MGLGVMGGEAVELGAMGLEADGTGGSGAWGAMRLKDRGAGGVEARGNGVGGQWSWG